MGWRSLQIGFAAVGWVVIAIRPIRLTGGDRASAIGARGGCVRKRAYLAAGAAVIDLGRRRHFATIRGVAVAIGKAGAARRGAFRPGTTSSTTRRSVRISALGATGAAVVGTVL